MTDGQTIRRLILALELIPEIDETIDQAVDLAEGLDVELTAIVVEDSSAFKMAALPFTKEVSMLSRREESIDERALERQVRRRIDAIRQRLITSAERARVRHTIVRRRGIPTREIERELGETDLLVLGRQTGFDSQRHMAVPILRNAPSSHIAVVARTQPRERRVHVFYGASESGRTALGIAARLAAARGALLSIFTTASVDQLAPEIDAALVAANQAFEVLTITSTNPERRLAETISRLEGTLVLGRDSAVCQDRELSATVGRIDWPVIIVR